jgi:Nitrile hydratase, alpha chain
MAGKAYSTPAINEFVVLENSETVRHRVACTLCFCYPRPILGRQPDLYKSFDYRQRAVSDPRCEARVWLGFGPPDVEVRIHASTPNAWFTASARTSQSDTGCSL